MSDYEERARAFLKPTGVWAPSAGRLAALLREVAEERDADLAYQEECVQEAHGVTAHVRGLHRAVEAERDQLRAEVERLRREPMHPAHLYREHNTRLLADLAAERERVERLRAEVRRAREMRDLLRVYDVPGWQVSAEGMQVGWDAWVAASDALHPGDLDEDAITSEGWDPDLICCLTCMRRYERSEQS